MRNISKSGVLDPAAAERLEALLLDMFRSRGMRDPMSGICEPASLTPPQIHALMWLGHDGPLPMGDLARRGGITEKTITGVVDRLERAGLLQRERNSSDRRVVHVGLTAEGEAMFRTLRDQGRRRVHAVLQLLDQEDRDALFRILEKLRDRLAAPREEGNGEA